MSGFGARVRFDTVMAKRRTFMGSWRGTGVLDPGRELVRSHTQVHVVPGERPMHSWSSLRDFGDLEVVRSGRPPMERRSEHTRVDLVRWPLEGAREGVVIGASHRHAGVVAPGDYGNTWTSCGAVAFVAVAVDTGMAQPLVYDVLPDDLAEVSS